MWFAVKMFRDSVLSIRDNQANGVIAIAMDWNDPVVASRWANDFVALANESIRSRALEDAKRNIAYLEQQAARTDVVELRNVLYNLIESETQTLMLANGKLEYAFTIVDPAVPPEMRISPQRTLMVLAGMLFGTALGTIIAFSHSMLLRYRRRTRATYDAGTA